MDMATKMTVTEAAQLLGSLGGTASEARPMTPAKIAARRRNVAKATVALRAKREATAARVAAMVPNPGAETVSTAAKAARGRSGTRVRLPAAPPSTGARCEPVRSCPGAAAGETSGPTAAYPTPQAQETRP